MKERKVKRSYLLVTALLTLSTVLKLCSVIVLVTVPVHTKVLEHVIEKEELPHDMELKAMLKKNKQKTGEVLVN